LVVFLSVIFLLVRNIPLFRFSRLNFRCETCMRNLYDNTANVNLLVQNTVLSSDRLLPAVRLRGIASVDEMNTEHPNTKSWPEGVDVILPAGGRIQGEFAQQVGTEVKALARFAGETLLRRTVAALRATGLVRRIVVVGGDEACAEALACGADGTVAEGATMPENILRGMEWLQGQPGGATSRVLDVTTDLPFLTADAFRRFLFACPPHADVVVPIVTQQAFEARFPGSHNEYTRLRDGAFTLGCAILFSSEALQSNRQRLEAMFAARKSQWRMAALIGPRIAWRFATRQLTVDDVIARVCVLMGCRGIVVVRDAPPELAYDIDLPGEYDYACRLLNNEKTVSKESTR
jgi:CTP:molybdopterin cytidylyltransferase MocA